MEVPTSLGSGSSQKSGDESALNARSFETVIWATGWVVDPESMNPVSDKDLEFQVNLDPDPIRIQGFDDQKLKKINTAEIFISIFLIAIYLALVLHKGRPSYRRSLQLSKENIQHFKK